MACMHIPLRKHGFFVLSTLVVAERNHEVWRRILCQLPNCPLLGVARHPSALLYSCFVKKFWAHASYYHCVTSHYIVEQHLINRVLRKVPSLTQRNRTAISFPP